MEYGFCTGFASKKLFSLGSELIPDVKAAGFDFVEFPLISIVSLGDLEFSQLKEKMKCSGLGCDCSCNFFPGSLSLFSDSKQTLDAYVNLALKRASELNVKKVMFGSAGFRMRPSTITREEGFKVLVDFCASSVVPVAEKYKIHVLIEPLNRGECNLVNTVSEGLSLVEAVKSPNFGLMVDLYHMAENGEDASILKSLIGRIEHVHLCNSDRHLPTVAFDDYILQALLIIKENGYDLTISYESKFDEKIADSLTLLKATVQKI